MNLIQPYRGVTIHFFHKRYVSRYLMFITIRITIRFIGNCNYSLKSMLGDMGTAMFCFIWGRLRTSEIINTVDSRYLEFDGTMEKIRVNRSSTQEELWKYQKCSLFNDERERTRAKFWRAKTSIACLDSRNDLKLIRCFCCCFISVKFFESCGMTDNCSISFFFVCMIMFICCVALIQ